MEKNWSLNVTKRSGKWEAADIIEFTLCLGFIYFVYSRQIAEEDPVVIF